MSQIFISYAKEDVDFAHRLAGAFEGHGWTVWWDKQIPPGMDYAHVIEAAIKEAQCVVVLWSKHSIRSRWVQTEAAAGADRNIVATVIVDDTPGESIPFEFRRLQAVNLRDWRPGVENAVFDLLANRVRSILDEPLKPPSPPEPFSDKVSWKEALTSWGSGKQRGYRIAGAVSAFLGLSACSEALNWEDPDMFAASAILLGVAVYLIFLGRKVS